MATAHFKNRAIKATLETTKACHKTQVCHVYELKIHRSKLNGTSRIHLARLFLEAKWFYNWVPSQVDAFNVGNTVQNAPVKVGDVFEDYQKQIPVASEEESEPMDLEMTTATSSRVFSWFDESSYFKRLKQLAERGKTFTRGLKSIPASVVFRNIESRINKLFVKVEEMPINKEARTDLIKQLKKFNDELKIMLNDAAVRLGDISTKIRIWETFVDGISTVRHIDVPTLLVVLQGLGSKSPECMESYSKAKRCG